MTGGLPGWRFMRAMFQHRAITSIMAIFLSAVLLSGCSFVTVRGAGGVDVQHAACIFTLSPDSQAVVIDRVGVGVSLSETDVTLGFVKDTRVIDWAPDRCQAFFFVRDEKAEMALRSFFLERHIEVDKLCFVARG